MWSGFFSEFEFVLSDANIWHLVWNKGLAEAQKPDEARCVIICGKIWEQ